MPAGAHRLVRGEVVQERRIEVRSWSCVCGNFAVKASEAAANRAYDEHVAAVLKAEAKARNGG